MDRNDQNEWKPDQNIRKIGLTAFTVVAASLLFYFVVFKTSSLGKGIAVVLEVLNPIIYGYIIAYLLNPEMQLLENLVYKGIAKTSWKPKHKMKIAIRVTCTLIALASALLIIYALMAMIIPELISSIRNIIYNYQHYVDNINQFIRDNFQNEEMDEKTIAMINEIADYVQKWISTEVTPQLNAIGRDVTNGLLGLLEFFKNAFLGIIISLYILIAKETLLARLRRLIYALFPITTGNRILFNLRFVDEKFGGFFIGKLIDSAIIGVICYIFSLILGFPYAILISVFIGVTNIIPFFGPFIGAIPATFLIFVEDPFKALIFIIFILCLQQFDGNFLGPKILGSSVGVSSYMVILAILIGSGFWGVRGMVVSVPLCAVLVAIIQSWLLRRMKDKGLPGDLESYHALTRINPETMELINDRDKKKSKSLYDRISSKNAAARSMEEPLKEKTWERTMEQIEEEDRRMEGLNREKEPEEES